MEKLKWMTFKGQRVSLDTIDHQHLSNCFWFLQIFGNGPTGLQETIDELDERFNGQILSYRPHIKFKYEIQHLIKNGMLEEKTRPSVENVFGIMVMEKIPVYYYNINFKGNKIGEITSPYNLIEE